MKKIVIVANFCRGLDGTNHSRFVYLAKMLQATGRYNVELITSDFHHLAKQHIDNSHTKNYNFKIKLCHEPGYVSHKGLKRLISHRKWGINVLNYLKSQPVPDIIYCAIPSLTAAHNLSLYCHDNGIKFVIDIQDLWPEAIFMLFKNRLLRVCFTPMAKYAEVAYKYANAIVAVSKTYVDRAKSVNTKNANTLAVFLGNDGKRFAKAKKDDKTRTEDVFTIGYIGTISFSYDIGLIIEAIKHLNDSGRSCLIKFLVMGDGPLKDKFRQYAKNLGVECEFTGYLPYDRMVGRLCKCDILVNPIVKGAAQSITNKVGDYALAGRPVVNTQESEEYRRLIELYNCGINCTPGDSLDVARAIAELIDNSELRAIMGMNSLKLGLELFNREVSYYRIIDLLDRLE